MSGTGAAVRGRPDGVLIDAARRGDLVAWEQLVRRHQEAVFRVAYLVSRDSRVAEAASRSAFVRAYRALPQLPPDQPFLSWLFRIVTGETRQLRRDASRPRPTSRPVESPVGPSFPATPVAVPTEAGRLTTAERAALRDAFERLGEEERLTLASRYLFGQSKSEAAATLMISESRVDEQLATALRHLRSRITTA